jgi:hypothetical protein
LASSLSVPCLTLLRARFTEPTGSPRPLVVSYTTVSPLPRALARGGFLSVALSRGLPRVGVTHRPALWSPDVPRHSDLLREKSRATRPSCRPIRPSDYRAAAAGPVSQSPDSSLRTRIAPLSGQSATSSGAERRRTARSDSVKVTLLPIDTPRTRSAAPIP